MKPYVAAVAVVGGSGSGKTSLISGALPRLSRTGGRFVVIKHTAHGYDPGPATTAPVAASDAGAAGAGKDSGRFLAAGATGVVLVGPDRLALIGRGAAPIEEPLPTAAEPSRPNPLLDHAIDRAVATFGRPDLVIVEGFGASPWPKIFVTGGRPKPFTGAVYAPDRYPAGVLAVALGSGATSISDGIPAAVPRLSTLDGEAWADFLGGLALRRPAPLGGVILAGGRSSRLGRNKAFLDFGGRPLIARVADLLRSLVSEVVIVANEPEPYEPFADRVVSDVVPGLGPLGGIYAGLLAVRGRAALFAGCDLPFTPAALYERLGREVGEADAAVPFAGGEYEPLVAAYARACLPAVEAAMLAGRHRVVSFYSGVRLAVLAEQEVRAFGDPKTLFLNINSEADYERAMALEPEA
ncbi:MAG: molybdopterin-guanine dinucleotide biosynthesis protein MobB [Bacillota bacterium]